MPEQDPNPPASETQPEPIKTAEAFDEAPDQPSEADRSTPPVKSANETPTTDPHEDQPVLDVHPPHEKIHTVKDFLIHIAAIAVGLLLAIGLEQAVEHLHQRHQIHQMEADLHAEDIENLAIIKIDLETIARTLAEANTAIAALQATATSPIATPIQPLSEITLFPPGSSAWSATRDSGLVAIAPRSLVDNYWKVYFTQEAAVLQIRAAYSDLDHLQALASLHDSNFASPLSPADREAMLLGYANYRENLKVLRIDLGLLERSTQMVLNDQAINIESLN